MVELTGILPGGKPLGVAASRKKLERALALLGVLTPGDFASGSPLFEVIVSDLESVLGFFRPYGDTGGNDEVDDLVVDSESDVSSTFADVEGLDHLGGASTLDDEVAIPVVQQSVHGDSLQSGQVTGATVSGVGSGAAGAAPDVGPTVEDGSDIQVSGYSSQGLVDAGSADSPLAAGPTPAPAPGANPNAKWLPLTLYRQLGRAARAQAPSESAVTVTWASGRSETFRTPLTEAEWVEALASVEREAGLARKARALLSIDEEAR